MKTVVTITDAQRKTLKELADWAQTSDSITEAESAVLDHLLAVPEPIATPDGHTMKEYDLTQAGKRRVTFQGVALTPEPCGTFVASDVHVFRTQAGELILYVGTVGYQRTRAHVQRLYRNAEHLTADEVVAACNGLADDAERALIALGISTKETIA